MKVIKAKHAHRVTEQQNRQKFGQQQKTVHTYASNVECTKEPVSSTAPKCCECGSTTHKQKTHSSCPLNKSKHVKSERTSLVVNDLCENDIHDIPSNASHQQAKC